MCQKSQILTTVKTLTAFQLFPCFWKVLSILHIWYVIIYTVCIRKFCAQVCVCLLACACMLVTVIVLVFSLNLFVCVCMSEKMCEVFTSMCV